MYMITRSNHNVHSTNFNRASYNFSVIADFTILIDPTRAFVCNFRISTGIPSSLNPRVFRFVTKEFVIRPVAPNTTGTTVKEYSG